MKLCLGLDTSCYTTSLALLDSEGNLLSEARKMLSVPEGGRGLAQNEGVFQHIHNLPELMEKLLAGVEREAVKLIAASTRPRPQEGSYMPVFKVAESFGRSLALAYDIPFMASSHQEGHIAAGIWSAGVPELEEFLAFHVSGGTTELLKVKRNGQKKGFAAGFEIQLLGGSNDIHAGQLIDRIGVALGLPFPAGPYLEKLALEKETDLSLPSAVKGYAVSFSGPEAAATRLIAQKERPADVARAVEKCIARSLNKLLKKALEDTGYTKVLVVGGVLANQYIRNQILLEMARIKNIQLYFARPMYSGDNAVGVASLGLGFLNK